ncbi:hypothetical protein C1X05_10725 [Laceyella sacchari]|uniref:Uncharacterized protein n=1 Tax=Laceyella tengchongensis TaxID=574699 RepID=A0AA45WKZ1_9BACL|nr:hypothetical protein C1X05_10725 [Laceyella sacchari]SMP09511.1 hypothetical protein SAMN06265361_102104 [Laceyella tengchongensis]
MGARGLNASPFHKERHGSTGFYNRIIKKQSLDHIFKDKNDIAHWLSSFLMKTVSAELKVEPIAVMGAHEELMQKQFIYTQLFTDKIQGSLSYETSLSCNLYAKGNCVYESIVS